MCNCVTDVCLLSLSGGCEQLQSINLRKCSHITDVGISALARGCSELESIDLALCNITDILYMYILALIFGCKKLNEIDLTCCNKITGKCVIDLRSRKCDVIINNL